jgi:MFS family permease
MNMSLSIGDAVRRRDFRLFWLGGAISRLGSHATGVTMPILVLALGGSPVTAGLLGSVGTGVSVLATPVAGVYADRRSRRGLLIGSALLSAAAMAVVAVGVATDLMSWPVLFASVAVEGMATAVFGAAAAGSVRAILPAENPEGALGLIQAREQGAQLAGPGFGGALYQLAAWVPFLADAVSYLLAAAFIRGTRSNLGPHRDELAVATPGSLRHELAAGIGYLWQQAFLRFVVLWAAGLNLIVGALYLEVILLARLRGTSAAAIGLMLTLVGCAGLVGALAAPRVLRRVRVSVLVVAVSWLVAAVLVLPATVSATWAGGVVLGAIALLTPALSIVFQSKAILMTPDGMQGRVGSALGTVAEGTGALAPLLAGVLVSWRHPAAVALLLAAGLAVLALYATVSMRRLRAGEPATEQVETPTPVGG